MKKIYEINDLVMALDVLDGAHRLLNVDAISKEWHAGLVSYAEGVISSILEQEHLMDDAVYHGVPYLTEKLAMAIGDCKVTYHDRVFAVTRDGYIGRIVKDLVKVSSPSQLHSWFYSGMNMSNNDKENK